MVNSAFLNGEQIEARVVGAIAQIQVEWSMDVANALTITFADQDHELWSSGLLDAAIDLQLDNGGGRWTLDRDHGLGSASTTNNQTILQFWDYPSGLLKQPSKSIAKSSSSMDLAAWCRLLVREVRQEQPFVVVAPRPGFIAEPHDKSNKRATNSTPQTKQPGGQPAGQKAGWCDTGATIYSGIPGATGSFGSLLEPGYHYAELGTASTTTGGATGHGNLFDAFRAAGFNVPQLDASHAELPEHYKIDIECNGHIITAEKGDRGAGQAPYGPDGGGTPAYSIDLWLGGGSSSNAQTALGFSGKGPVKARPHSPVTASTAQDGVNTVSREITKPAEWKRSGNTWHALGQLGARIGRRRFVALPRNPTPRLVFARDQDLILALPHMIIGINDGLLTSPVAIDLNGHSRIQTVDLEVFADAWIAPPGAVVQLDDSFGPAAGPWLVLTVVSTTGDTSAQVTLTKPTTQPHPVTVEDKVLGPTGSVVITGEAGKPILQKIAGVVEMGIFLSSKHLAYNKSNVVQKYPAYERGGYDCAGGVAYCIYNAGFPLPAGGGVGKYGPYSTTWESWGIPGQGRYMTVWANSDHVFIEFKLPGVGHVGFDSGHSGALSNHDFWYQDPFRDNAYVQSGFTPRHWPGG